MHPYAKHSNVAAVFHIASGVKPFTRPVATTLIEENLWALFESCWVSDPDARPSALDFMQVIRNVRSNYEVCASN